MRAALAAMTSARDLNARLLQARQQRIDAVVVERRGDRKYERRTLDEIRKETIEELGEHSRSFRDLRREAFVEVKRSLMPTVATVRAEFKQAKVEHRRVQRPSPVVVGTTDSIQAEILTQLRRIDARAEMADIRRQHEGQSVSDLIGHYETAVNGMVTPGSDAYDHHVRAYALQELIEQQVPLARIGGTTADTIDGNVQRALTRLQPIRERLVTEDVRQWEAEAAALDRELGENETGISILLAGMTR